MKTFYLWAARYFLVQIIFVTIWIALGTIHDTREVRNFKFFSWSISIVLGIVAMVLYNREKKKLGKG
jgi:hypothetical protein